ncbi:MAG: hypothetical protein ACFE9J_07960 [Candidatus Hermodarchaeota archaeon]
MLSNGVAESLDTSIWNNLPDEVPFIINFYTNDSAGNVNSDHSLMLYKDVSEPLLTVDMPTDDTYWNVPPDIQATGSDPYFDSVWYVVDGTKIMLSNAVAEPLDTSIWNSLPDEASFIIYFYANDSAGNINSDNSLMMYRDTSKPSLVVNIPADNTYWNIPPDIQVTGSDPYFDSVWYIVDGTKIMLSNGISEPLDGSIWNSLPDEAPFTISFYANDSAGNINSDHLLTLYKDISEPSVIVNLPIDGTYWNAPPDIQVSVSDPYFDSVWYVVDGTKIILSNGISEPLDGSVWNSLPDEAPFTISFYANDTTGNINGDNSLMVYKDISKPSLVVNIPADNTYWNTPPDILVTGSDPYFDSVWYIVDGTKIILSNGVSEPLDTSIWDSLTDELPFTMNFYANDSAGNFNSDYSLTLYKDVSEPSVIVNLPIDGTYWNALPDIEVTVSDLNFDSAWYVVDGIKIMLSNGVAEPLDSYIWNNLPDEGPFTINFYANDSANNINDEFSFTLYKDVVSPDITITTPILNELFGVKAPGYDISINELNLQNTWYYLYNGTLTSQNIPFTFLIDTTVSENIWDMFGNGTVTIVFNANDSAGNYGFDSITIRKDVVPPYISVNLPNSNDLFSHNSPNYNVRINDINGIDTSWYSLNYGINNYFTSNGSISQTLWENLDNGTVTIQFYANDSVGNIGYNSIFVRKDTLPPVINIYEPNPYDQYGTNPPDSNVEFIDGNLDATWYQLIGTSTTDNYAWTGIIESYIWNQMGNGLVVIQFYANDSLGNFGSNSVIIRKDTEAPDVTINSPENDDLYGFVPPEVNVDFGPEVIDQWYQLIGTTTTANYSWTGTIEQYVWDEVGNGTVFIFIYANDSLGNIGYDTVMLKKDIIEPDIIINEPLPNSLFGTKAPLLELDINEGNLDQTWYQLLGTITTDNYTWNEVIAQNLWDQMGNGTVTVIFYANDTIGNFGSESIILRKDIIAPQITISQPDPYSLFGTAPPGVTVEFLDPHLDSTWYQLSNETVSTNNYTWAGTIHQSAWEQIGNGTVNIIFYVNDTLGNLNSDMIVVRKDIIKPTIIINNPNMYELFGKTPPLAIVTINDAHLEAAWYQLSNGTITTANYSWMGIIDHIIWDQIGNGTVDLLFYANDSVGNLASKTVIVRKDIISPKITIIEPTSYELFGITPPNVEVDIFDPNLNTIWYQLTDGTTSDNYTWSGNIDQNAWNLFGTGLVNIEFYANDSIGNLGYNSVTIRKDLTAPDITINDPQPFELFGKLPSPVDLNVQDPNLNMIWYKLFNATKSTANYTWIDNIEQSVWDEFVSGIITIRFYANDTLGNLRFSDVTIIKDITPPSITINNPDPYELFGLTSPKIDINIIESNLDDVWYQLTNGIITTFNHTWTGSISQAVWDELGNGTVDIIFYANDTLSNLASRIITVRKDITIPNISIDYPSPYSLHGIVPPDISLDVDDPNLDSIWYQIDNGTNTTGNNSWTGNIEQSIWNEIGNGTATIIIYANDTVGNLASDTLIVRKDIIAPDITINNPNPYDLFGIIPPVTNVEFNDPHLSDMWYQLSNGTITTVNSTWTGIIEQSVWEQMGNGTVMIIIYANDSLGNIGINSVLVQRDVIAPIIIINYPDPYDVFGESAPDFDIIFNDKNLDEVWFQLKNESVTTQNYTWTGILEQSIWDEVGNGTVTFFFYANDSMSNFRSTEIIIIKDLSAPLINIIEPEMNAIFGYNAPNVKIYISSVDVYNSWYILLGNSHKYYFTKTDGITILPINQTAWDEFGNGTVTIEFYVNDSVGNIGFDSIDLRKDIFTPDVIINLPIYEGYWSDPPILNVSFFDPNPDSLWYEIGPFHGNLINNTEQTIDPLIWDSLEQGENQIFIFANDTAGNVNHTYVYTIYKDTLAPLIIINSPIDGTTSNSPPVFNITCFDPNFDALWYGDGIFNITLANNTDQFLDWGIWHSLPEGLYTVLIYANDTFGHLNDIHTLILYKDTEAPDVKIDQPYNHTYLNHPPLMSITASDPNLDTLWYSFGSYDIQITDVFQELNAEIWNSLDEGAFQINIYANDTLGNINTNYSLALYKDTISPKILINSPLNQTFWNTRPLLNVTAFDPNLESIYYGFSTYFYPLDNNTQTPLSLYIWANLPEGEFQIQFFAEDLAGNLNDTYILTLFKDTIEPNIIINSPSPNSLYEKDAPDFNISVSKFNLDKVWYSLIGYPEDYILNEFTGTINQTAWDNFEEGTVIIRFYANDTSGNVKTQDITVRKDIIAPTIRVNRPIDRSVWDSPPIIKVYITDMNLDSIWYTIGTSSSNLANNIEQQLDYMIWDNLPEGEFYLYISANDSLGNINNSFYLTLYKDTLAPNISINLPVQNQEVGETAPQYDLTIMEENLATLWYTLDGGITNKTFTQSLGQIDQQIWDQIWESHADGAQIIIRFYANDTLNHLGYKDVTIRIKKSGLFELKNPIMLYTSGILVGVLGTATITVKNTKKYKRIDKKQKKKVNSILYLSLLLTGLLLLTAFI